MRACYATLAATSALNCALLITAVCVDWNAFAWVEVSAVKSETVNPEIAVVAIDGINVEVARDEKFVAERPANCVEVKALNSVVLRDRKSVV